MENKVPVKRLIICAAIAIAAIVLGIFNVSSQGYSTINDVFQSILAAVGLSAIGEFSVALSKFPIISYIISVVFCMVVLQIITPIIIVFLFTVSFEPDVIIQGYRVIATSCLVVYSIALVVSILFGIFVLHRKEIFKSNK